MLPSYIVNFMTEKALKKFNLEDYPISERYEKKSSLLIKLDIEYKVQIEVPYKMLPAFLWDELEEDKKTNLAFKDFEDGCSLAEYSNFEDVGELVEGIFKDIEARTLDFGEEE